LNIDKGRVLFGPYTVIDVCIHNTESINNRESITEEAYYCMVVLIQQHGL